MTWLREHGLTLVAVSLTIIGLSLFAVAMERLVIAGVGDCVSAPPHFRPDIEQ